MAAINKAAIDALIDSIITSQTAPESITPSSLGSLLAAFSESYWNKVDGIQVSGMTDMLAGISNGQNIEAILSIIMAAIANVNTASDMIPYLFHAEKTADHVIETWSTNSKFITPFEDNAAAPNFDTTKLFYRDSFTANAAMTKTFVLEKLALQCISPGSDQWKTVITKNGTPIASSLAKSVSDVDEYGNSFDDTDGYTFPSLVAANVSLAPGDVVSAGVLCFNKSGGSGTVYLKSTHPSGKPRFYNS